MLRVSRGQVVTIASLAAIANARGMVAYNTAKAGVLSSSESLRGEEYDNDVGVTVACPAFFAIHLLESFRDTDPRQQETVARLMKRAGLNAPTWLRIFMTRRWPTVFW